MKTIDAKITSQGQVTIPAEVRRHLGLSRGERMAFVTDGERVSIEPTRFTLTSIVGSIEPLHAMSDDFDLEIEQAMSEEADRRMRAQLSV